MKKSVLILLLFLPLLLSSCFSWGPDDIEPQYEYSPVIMSRQEFESSVQGLPQQNIVKSGKIYINENLMFVNDVNKGFHVYNYSDPANPQRIGFIKIAGATDLAIRNNIIYINQAVDLVTLTYNPSNNAIAVLHRNENVFPQKPDPNGMTANTDNDEIVIDWIQN